MLHPDRAQWQQAARGFAQAGLGLRSCATHAPAAYLASLGSSLSACKDIDSRFSAAAVSSSPAVAAAIVELNRQLPANQALTTQAALACKQRDLSERLDTAGWEQQLAQAGAAEAAVLRSEAGVGARAFLAAVPSGKTTMEPAVFVQELRFRLGMPDASEDTWCPKCDAVLDKLSHHAAVCVAGGERTLRHNAVRDVVFDWAVRAGLAPEKERAGLLPPHASEDASSARRRPADVYLPSWAGSPAALDFAVTAPQRQETLAQAGKEAGAAAADYARHKEAHLGTAAACAAQGITFRPMVVETTGHWERQASALLKQLAGAVATRSGEDAAPVHASLLQELSVVVRSFRARAALRRRCELPAA